MENTVNPEMYRRIIQGTGELLVTDFGGIAVRLFNRTADVTKKGSVVAPSFDQPGAFCLVVANAQDPMGILLEDDIPIGGKAWVVINGMVDVLLENGTAATRGYWARGSTSDAGRADITNSGPPGNSIQHYSEIGHSLETKSAGTDVLCRIMIHFL